MLYILAYILLVSSFLYGAELNIKKRPRPDSEEVQESNKKIKTGDSEYSYDDINRIIAHYYKRKYPESKSTPPTLSDNNLLHRLIMTKLPLSLIKKVINHKPEYLDIFDEYNLTPLHTAAEYGTPEVIEYLIEQRPSHLYEENCRYSFGFNDGFATPLFHAIRTFKVDRAITLLKHCDVKYMNSIGENVYKFLFKGDMYRYDSLNGCRSDKYTRKFFSLFKALYEADPKYAQDNSKPIIWGENLSFLLVPYLIEKKDFLLLNKIKFHEEYGQTPESRKSAIWNGNIFAYDEVFSLLLTKYSPNSEEINIAIKVFSLRSPHNVILSCLHNNIPIPKNITESYIVYFHGTLIDFEKLIDYVRKEKCIPFDPIHEVIEDFADLKEEVTTLIKTSQYEQLQEYIGNFSEFCNINDEEYGDEDSFEGDCEFKPYAPFLLFVFSYEQLSKIIIEKLAGQTQDARNFFEIAETQIYLPDIRDEKNNSLIFHAIKHDQKNELFNRPGLDLGDSKKSLTLMFLSRYPEFLTEAIQQSLSHLPLFEKLFYDATSKHYKMPNYKERHNVALKKRTQELDDKEVDSWFNQDID